MGTIAKLRQLELDYYKELSEINLKYSKLENMTRRIMIMGISIVVVTAVTAIIVVNNL